MATFNKVDNWVLEMGRGANLNTDTFVLYLCTNANVPVQATTTGRTTGITNSTGGYAETDIQNTWTEASGTGTLNVGGAGNDVVYTATGAGFGPFQHAVIMDDTLTTPVADPVVCWHDYGSTITLVAAGETFTWNSDGTLFTIS